MTSVLLNWKPDIRILFVDNKFIIKSLKDTSLKLTKDGQIKSLKLSEKKVWKQVGG